MYKIVHDPAACEAEKKIVPDPPQALSVLFLPGVIIHALSGKSNLIIFQSWYNFCWNELKGRGYYEYLQS